MCRRLDAYYSDDWVRCQALSFKLFIFVITLIYNREHSMPNSTAYSDLLAYHYSAYRPPLHALILKRLLAPENSFQTGVDIGCGTGYSARALAPYCEHVYGVDPSQPMLSEAEPSATITYQLGAAENTSLPNGVANIITYAGSLFYADIALAVKELQ